jgi:hypothetical protein
MNIEISKKEYRTLLDVLHIADWVLHAHKTEEGLETEEFRLLEQKFLSLAEDMGFGHFVEYDPDMKKYFPTGEYEETSSVMEAIVDYDNESFWEELTERLATRDLIQQEGKDKVVALEFEERMIKMETFQGRYEEEFERQGLNRLVIKD